MSSTLNIKITGLKDAIDEFLLNDSQSARLKTAVLFQATNTVLESWKKQARNGLHSTREQYIRSLGLIVGNNYENTIMLQGQLPNMIESGAGSFDMKESFANSPKAKHSKDGGWYLTIPFRYAIPGSLAESGAFAGVMPAAIYALVKDFKSKSDLGKGSKETLKPIDIPEEYSSKRKKGSDKINKSSLYEGLTKSSNTYEEATQGQYHTMRRVSDKSDPSAFIHPGFVAANYAEKALNDSKLDTVINNTIDLFLSQIK